MRFTLHLLLLAFLAALAYAGAAQKAIVVSYPSDTPDSVLEQAKAAIKEAGGVITHEYSLIKAFAANAPAKVIQSVQAWGVDHNIIVEEDQVVNANSA
ncbi:hypothetical protein M8818_005957 [Zalaria obscura]|uniref:Uncharacterized protein n=1 Tax=Zalaria obscura TaxID=2024903 RepID=A0ACC3S6M2_9PEZI